MFLTTLLLVNTTDTGFSLVDFNEALEIVLLVWPVQDLWAGFILYTANWVDTTWHKHSTFMIVGMIVAIIVV